jgi:TRAP-type C4-dicarboxylate transport system permease small subunit
MSHSQGFIWSIGRILTGIARAISMVSLAAICVMMFLTAADVIGRYLLNKPIGPSKDLTEVLMVIVVFMGISHTQVIGGHVRVDILFSRISKHGQAVLDTFTMFVSGIVYILISWQLGKRAISVLLNPESYMATTGTMHWPIGPYVLIASVGCLVLSLVLMKRFISSLFTVIKSKDTDKQKQ